MYMCKAMELWEERELRMEEVHVYIRKVTWEKRAESVHIRSLPYSIGKRDHSERELKYRNPQSLHGKQSGRMSRQYRNRMLGRHYRRRILRDCERIQRKMFMWRGRERDPFSVKLSSPIP